MVTSASWFCKTADTETRGAEGTLRHFRGYCAGWGLSPRVRGSRGQRFGDLIKTGSLPACAGEPALEDDFRTLLEQSLDFIS
jgi:hypothetical protein